MADCSPAPDSAQDALNAPTIGRSSALAYRQARGATQPGLGYFVPPITLLAGSSATLAAARRDVEAPDEDRRESIKMLSPCLKGGKFAPSAVASCSVSAAIYGVSLIRRSLALDQ